MSIQIHYLRQMRLHMLTDITDAYFDVRSLGWFAGSNLWEFAVVSNYKKSSMLELPDIVLRSNSQCLLRSSHSDWRLEAIVSRLPCRDPAYRFSYEQGCHRAPDSLCGHF